MIIRPVLAQTWNSPRSLDVNVDVLVVRSGGYICNMCQGVFCAWFNANLLWPVTSDSYGILLQGQWWAVAASKQSWRRASHVGFAVHQVCTFSSTVYFVTIHLNVTNVHRANDFFLVKYANLSCSHNGKYHYFFHPSRCTGTAGWLCNKFATA